MAVFHCYSFKALCWELYTEIWAVTYLWMCPIVQACMKRHVKTLRTDGSSTKPCGLLIREYTLGLTVNMLHSKRILCRCCSSVYDIISLPTAVR